MGQQENLDTKVTAHASPSSSIISGLGIYDDAVILRADKFSYELAKAQEGDPLSLENLNKAHELISEIQSDVSAWYEGKFGVQFNRFQLGNERQEVRLEFLNHKKFDEVLDLLGIDVAIKDKIRLPWWSEVAMLEVNTSSYENEVKVLFTPVHSFHIQLLRSKDLTEDEKGKLPVSGHTVTVSGLLTTTPSSDAPNGKIAIGIRGGATLPNTIHMVAGAAKYSEEMIGNNPPTLKDIFTKTELKEETGYQADRSSVTPLARFVDAGLAPPPGDANYCFLVKTGLSEAALRETWGGNKDTDKDEHQNLLFINNDPASIRNFLESMYFGISENRNERTRDQMELLYPAAVALCAHAGIPLRELERIEEVNKPRRTWIN